MGDTPSLKYTATPPQPLTKDAPSFTPAGQDHAPSDLPDGRHGFTLQFEFQPPNTSAHHHITTPRPDIGRRVVHFCRERSEWPKTDFKFRSFFEVFTPTTGRVTAYARFNVSTTLTYRELKNDGILYSYLCTNSIFMTLHLFNDIESVSLGYLLFKHPKMTYRPPYQTTLMQDMHTLLSNPDTKSQLADHPEFHQFDFNDHTVPFISLSDRTIQHNSMNPDWHTSDSPTNPTALIQSTVFELRCGKDDYRRATALLHYLTSNPQKKFHTGVFVSPKLRTDQPATFYKLLGTHNDFLATVRAVSVAGIAPDFWFSRPSDDITTPQYGQQILDIPGTITTNPDFRLIQWVETTNDTSHNGRYLIIYHSSQENHVFQFLSTTFVDWYTSSEIYSQVHDKYQQLGFSLRC